MREQVLLKIASSSPAKSLMHNDALQSVIHDLRTPITVIKGNLQLLISGIIGPLTEEQTMLLQRSLGPLDDLILMTENLLQSRTLDANYPAFKFEETDLDKLLNEMIEFYSPSFKQREMQIYRDGNTFGTKLFVDPFWLKRV